MLNHESETVAMKFINDIKKALDEVRPEMITAWTDECMQTTNNQCARIRLTDKLSISIHQYEDTTIGGLL